jgi:hypothetical protein
MTAVKTADPAATELDAAFATAMGETVRPSEPASAPREIDRAAPHGRAEDGAPLAPYGLKADGTPRLSASGRKSAKDTRITGAQPAAPAPAMTSGQDYTDGLRDMADAAWIGLSFAAKMPLEKLPVVGKIPAGKGRRLGELLAGAGPRLDAQALLLAEHRDALVGAVNLSAQHSERARRFAQKAGGGDATWVLVAATMVLPLVAASAALWQGELATEDLAASNQALLRQRLSQIKDVITDAASAETERAAAPAAA